MALSDKAESAAILLDAALRKYVDVYENGAKANPTNNPEAAASEKDDARQ